MSHQPPLVMPHLLAVTMGTASSSSCCGCRLLRRRLFHRLPPTPRLDFHTLDGSIRSPNFMIPWGSHFHWCIQPKCEEYVDSRWYAMLKILLAKQDILSQNYTQVFWGFMEFSRIPFVVSSTELPNRTLGFSNAPGLVGLANLYKIEDIFRRHWGA
jgi:hypothetical protein